MTVPNYTYACVPEQADVTINQTNLNTEGVASYFRTYSTRNSTLTLDATRTVAVLATVPIDPDQVGVFEEGTRLALTSQYTISGQVLTFLAPVPAGRQIDVAFMSTTPGSTQNAVQIGIIVTFDDALTAPDGWLHCLGQAVSRTTYAALFAVIGTTYGVGNGTTTFNLPTIADSIIKV